MQTIVKPAESLIDFSDQPDFVATLCKQVNLLPYISNRIYHASVSVDRQDLIAFLSNNTSHQQMYWHERDQDRVLAGLGVAVEVIKDSSAEAIAEVRNLSSRIFSQSEKAYLPWFFGGFSFAEEDESDIWQEFPSSYFVLPKICLSETQGACHLHIHLLCDGEAEWNTAKNDLIRLLLALDWDQSFPEHSDEDLQFQKCSSIDRVHWHDLCDQVQSDIDQKHVEKVVLARDLVLSSNDSMNVHQLLNRWLAVNPDTYSFMLQRGDKYLLGCSPERLYKREGQQLCTESLAGTVGRGDGLASDELLAQKLLNDSQFQNEHGLVSQFIQQQLEGVCSTVDFEPTQVMKLEKVQHLYQKVTAELNSNIDDAELINLLHPTPAVSGYPRNAALNFLSSNESLARGWYSGGIGIASYSDEREFVDFAVVIRSALLENNRLHCFSGVGLVEGSDSESEWQELDSKINSLLDVVYGTAQH
ncbi:isochorismate synthase [Neptuniibacter sp. QD48_55]|uniref:isochorismate synthase n=1 Tax=Neptuniibacter sp. QD48_55 TaxID=3398212 RepID=UPI0039F61A60